jgi:undecaprenyl-diphosphatase
MARTPTPAHDTAMSRLSRAANYSRFSLTSMALLALVGGRTGRRAATGGLASLGITATGINIAVKPLGRRRRPDRLAGDVPLARHVPITLSRPLPCGHSGTAFAFATGVGHVLPAAAIPLYALAAPVAYSRVHTAPHVPRQPPDDPGAAAELPACADRECADQLDDPDEPGRSSPSC